MPLLRFDSLAVASMGAYLLVTLVTVACAPKQDLREGRRAAFALAAGGTLLAYAAASPWLFLLGWLCSAWPVRQTTARWALLSSAGLLAAGFLGAGWAGFAALAGAAVIRKGLFPFHFWVPAAFKDGPLPVLNLVMNGHLGAYVMIRFAAPIHPDLAGTALPFIGLLAIFTAVWTALLALVADKPRRVLALLCISQASFILAGLENRNIEGITGALLHWWVVAFATTVLLAVTRALEARTSEAAAPDGFLGLAYHAPRLAVPFAVAALALVGLPGTLGFAAEDLLFHGSLESHPLLGAGLPLATALNAITALRLLAGLFLGKRGIHVPFIPDARPRERWALAVPVILLVAGGILPSLLVKLRSPAAETIAGLLAGR